MWPYWVQLANYVLEDDPKCHIVFTGEAGHSQGVEAIASRVAYPWRVSNLCGFTIFRQFVSLIASMDALITLNTSALHIGIAVKTPTVGIIGGTPARVVVPKDNPLVRYVEDPALQNWNNGKYRPSMGLIGPREVLDEYNKLEAK
jgi:ADP-heptose:LPS heptosyltransferase